MYIIKNFIYMLLLILVLPLIGSISCSLLGKYIGPRGSTILSTTFVALSFFFSIFLFFNNILFEDQYYLTLFSWINSGLFTCNWGLLFDTLTIVMLVVVTSISTLVHLYSTEYMAHDPHLARFMSYLSLFTFFMLILITADNFIQMFVGWEGVGFCSYLLINFWFTRLQANKAAIKAMLVNRISDFALVLGILTIFFHFKSVEYTSVFASVPLLKNYTFSFLTFNVNTLDTICILLLIGAMGKSAQLFLHTWLPDAMEGPTPVSALIHAATMVTAGVFLIARCSPLFEQSELALNCTTIIGALTAFFAGTVGLVQNDLKKIIAYSTCSQLGYMIFACGLSNYSLGIFHLSNHAFFKALLFLSAGSVIHAMADEQDIRKMGGLRRILPYTYIMFVIGSFALMGFPFLTGFYSKDVILEISYASFSTFGHFAYWLGTLAAFCTAFYSIRLLYLTFLIKTNAFKQIIINAHDAPLRMALPLGLLAFGSIYIGYLTKDMFIGLGSNFFGNSIFILPKNIQMIDAEFLPTYIKLLPVCFSSFGLCLAFVLYSYKIKSLYMFKMNQIGLNVYNFLNRKWFFDKIYHEFITQNFLNFSYHISYKLIDRGLIEILGPAGIVKFISNSSQKIILLQKGYIYNYSLIFCLGLIILNFTFLVNLIDFNLFIQICCFFGLLIIFNKP